MSDMENVEVVPAELAEGGKGVSSVDTLESESAEPEEPQEEVREGKPNEAAKYRVRLREAKAERDELREQVRQLRVRDVALEFEKYGSYITQILEAVGTDLMSFIGETGEIDSEKIKDVAEKLKVFSRKPSLSDRPKPNLKPYMTGGTTPGEELETSKTWQEALQAR